MANIAEKVSKSKTRKEMIFVDQILKSRLDFQIYFRFVIYTTQ